MKSLEVSSLGSPRPHGHPTADNHGAAQEGSLSQGRSTAASVLEEPHEVLDDALTGGRIEAPDAPCAMEAPA